MIFLDANFLVSFYIEDEKYHERALEIMEESKNKKKKLDCENRFNMVLKKKYSSFLGLVI